MFPTPDAGIVYLKFDLRLDSALEKKQINSISVWLPGNIPFLIMNTYYTQKGKCAETGKQNMLKQFLKWDTFGISLHIIYFSAKKKKRKTSICNLHLGEGRWKRMTRNTSEVS